MAFAEEPERARGVCDGPGENRRCLAADDALEGGLRVEAENVRADASATGEPLEGIAAFLQKRKPANYSVRRMTLRPNRDNRFTRQRRMEPRCRPGISC